MVATVVMIASMATGVGSGFMILIRSDWLILFCVLIFIYAFASMGAAKALEQARFPGLMQSGLMAADFHRPIF